MAITFNDPTAGSSTSDIIFTLDLKYCTPAFPLAGASTEVGGTTRRLDGSTDTDSATPIELHQATNAIGQVSHTA